MIQTPNMLNIVLLSLIASLVNAHGRLLSPLPRALHRNYENDPVHDPTQNPSLRATSGSDWICRHSQATPTQATLTAGSTATFDFRLTARHVGDCDISISYDWDLPLEEMRWFKIANLPNCRDQGIMVADEGEVDMNRVSINLPSWLKSGRAVLRWGWWALHNWPSIEFFTQCSDIQIEGVSNLPNDIETYMLPGIYPKDANEGKGYRNEWNGEVYGTDSFWMTGPACATDSDLNNCLLTAPGTKGNIDFTPASSTTSDPTSTSSTSTSTPICVSQMFVAVGDCLSDDLCQAICTHDNGALCPKVCQCIQETTLSTTSEATTTASSTSTTIEPTTSTATPSPDCFDIKPTSECLSHLANWDLCANTWWLSQCQATCNQCSTTSTSTSTTSTLLPSTTTSATPTSTMTSTSTSTTSTSTSVPSTTSTTSTSTSTSTSVPSTTSSTSTSTSTSSTTQPTSTSLTDGDQVRICYFQNWARYWPAFNHQDVFEKDLDATLCTHIQYGFLTIEDSTWDLKAYDPNADYVQGHGDSPCPDICKPGYVHDWATGANPCAWPCNPDRSRRGFDGMLKLKEENPDLKLIASVGGWNFNDCKKSDQANTGRFTCHIFSTIASSVEHSKTHALKVIAFLRHWGFDGYDVDWEYPVAAEHNNVDMQARPEDFANYIRFLQILREEFELEALNANDGRERLLLTAAVGVGKQTADQSYDISEMNDVLDLISLMTYDLNGAWETSSTNFNAPLYATEQDTALKGYPLSASWAVDYWLERGASANKLVLGMGTYGRGWKLASAGQNQGALSAANGAASRGPLTQMMGYLAYSEIQDLIQNQGATRYWDDARKVPYVITADGSEWHGYDDVQSLILKTDFLMSRGLRGVMFWALELDDVNGEYSNGQKYPLMNAVKETMTGYRSDPLSSTSLSSTKSSSTSSTSTTSSVASTVSTSSSTSAASKTNQANE